MKYRFRSTQRFWESFYALPSAQKDSTRRAWKILKENPFDSRLRSHKIRKLSARYGPHDLRSSDRRGLASCLYLEADVVVTVDIGAHTIYR